MARRGGLGKGLGALIPAAESGEHRGVWRSSRSRRSGRTRTSRGSTSTRRSSPSLAESIREVGILQPVLVRETDDGYELIAGERRWRAARRVGLQNIPALVRDTDDASALEHALVENVHRSDLNVLEEAAAYQQLIEDFGLTHEEVAIRVGRSRTAVTNTLRLLQLPPIGPAAGARRVADDGPRPGAARHARPRLAGAAGQAGRRRRASRSGRSRMRSASDRRLDRRRRAGRTTATTGPSDSPPRGSCARRAARAREPARRPPRHPGEGRHGRPSAAR